MNILTTTIGMMRKEEYICTLCGANHAFKITMTEPELDIDKKEALMACKMCCDLISMAIIRQFTKNRVNVEINLALLLTSIRKSYVLELSDVLRD